MSALFSVPNIVRRAGLAVLLCAFALSVNAGPRTANDRLLVKVKKNVSRADRNRSLAAAEGVESEMIPRIEYRVVKVKPERLEHALRTLQNDPNVEAVERDAIGEQTFLPNDPNVLNGNEWHLTTVQASQAWDITMGDPGIVVAVIDSGIAPPQTELTGQLLTGYNCFDNSTNVTEFVNGHGTITSGIVGAAANNGKGVAGLAPGCRVLPIKAIDASGFISWSDAAKAIIYAADHGAKVINMSFCGSVGMTALQNAVDYAWGKGVVLVAAAGNYGNNTIQYPAAYPHVIGVSSTDADDSLSTFSSFGSFVKLSAPGGGVWSTQLNSAYGPSWGTSMSSPVVAAVFGLVFSANDSLSNADAVDLVESNVDDLGTTGYDNYFGFGRVNAYKAVVAAASVPPVSDTTAPTVTVVAPVTSSTISNTVLIQVDASDDTGVTKLEWYVDGVLQSSTGVVPAQFLWDTTQFLNGPHTVMAKAYDASSNVGTSAAVSVQVQNQIQSPPPPPPSNPIDIAWPTDGSTLTTKKLKVVVSITDKSSVSAVKLFVDGQWVATRSRIPYTLNWNARGVLPGDHTLEAVAVDTQGNEMYSASVTVTKPAPASLTGNK